MASTSSKNNKGWSEIPSLILVDIYDRLSESDRLKASSTCVAWRECLFHPSLWGKLKLKLNSRKSRRTENNANNENERIIRNQSRLKKNPKKEVWLRNEAAHFLSQRCGRFPKEVSLVVDTRNYIDVKESLDVLEALTNNFNLQYFSLKPTSCQLQWRKIDCAQETPIPEVYTQKILKIIRNAPGLRHLSLGCVEELLEQSDRVLSQLGQCQPKSLESLHVSSVKNNPDHYMIPEIQAQLFEPFSNLRTLSLDYDYLNDDLLGLFTRNGQQPLANLFIHVHGIDQDHPGISESAWNQLVAYSPRLEVSLTLLHANNPPTLLREVLRSNMPLVTFRSYYTHGVDRSYLELLTTFNCRTLRSLTLVEGPRNEAQWTSLGGLPPELEDPLVMLAWRCQKLTEMTVIGFEIGESDLIAIARLRGVGLKKLEIPSCCIVSSPFLHWPMEEGSLNVDESYLCYDYSSEDSRAALLEEISSSLGCEWRPLTRNELPYSLLTTNYVADDETYMRTLLRDQRWIKQREN